MMNHLRANLFLLLLTIVVACGLYPAVMWVYANTLVPEAAKGSLIIEKGPEGEAIVRGSRWIAQPFTKDHYFQPRPSAASYNATASGGSNWGPNNPKLRDRVARQLATIVRYDPNGPKKGESVQKDIEMWFANHVPVSGEPPLVVKWAGDNPTLSAMWVKSDANRPAVVEWLGRHPKILAEWKPSDPETTKPDLGDDATIPFDDLVGPFFESFAAEYPNRWPEPEEFDTAEKNEKGETVKGKRFKPVAEGADLQATFFDSWLLAHPPADLQKVPADMVMASGSGLDPHITLRSANYQLDRVVTARVEATKRPPSEVRTKVEEVVRNHSFTPLGGLIGEPLVNVLEVNLALDRAIPVPVTSDD